ncbi:MAG: CaiB/BaiF CoA transferase family protein [Reyranellaceae bacterium]
MNALDGIKVVEFTQNLAGPYAGEILGWLGAEVVKIERPRTGDDCRAWGPPFINESSVVFNAMNRTKRSVTLDLKSPEGIAQARRLIAGCDVVIENLRPGSMEEIGLGAKELLQAHPRLIYGSISAFGSKGPLREKAGYEEVVQAYSGIFSVNGDERGRPSRIGSSILDMGTGVWMALGCMAALMRREKTGRGGLVESSLIETAMGILMQHVGNYTATGKVPMRTRSGTPRVVVCQVFPTLDGEVVIVAANDRLFRKLARALGHPEWAEDPRYGSSVGRVENKDELYSHMDPILAGDTTANWLARLEAAGVPCAPVNDIRGVLEHPHIAELGILETVEGSPLRLTGLPLSLDGVRPASYRPAPRLNQQGEEVLEATK